MRNQRRLLQFLALLALIAPAALAREIEDNRRELFADDMARFAEQDAEHPAAPGGILFVGSSSIRLWDLAESFPDLNPTPLNRGFGGSQLIDSIQRVDELVLKHKPRLVVIYAGDNDIAAGKDATRVVKDFQTLTAQLRESLPDAQIAYIAIKPSIVRWKLAPTMRDANNQIAELCEDDDHLTFIDVWQPMLGDDGRPRPELFRDDGLHLNKEGYKLWNALVRPVLDQEENSDRP